MRPSSLITSAALTCALGATGCAHAPQGSADPGGMRGDAMALVFDALPRQATVSYRNPPTAHWDSCDGRPSTFGWDPIVAQIAFTTREPMATAFGEIDAALLRQGWREATWAPSSPIGGDHLWSRTLSSGVPATASLTIEGDGSGQWILIAEAPPATHPASGC